jgi:tRNA-specific 2-thiouridylase
MSGGVDSSVAAALLAAEGCDCAGVTLKLFRDGEDNAGGRAAPPRERSCCSLSDTEDARAVAHRLGIPFYVFNFTERFERQVMDRFAAGYLAGETPNPCIDCNRFIKFSALLERASALDYGLISTGHYVRAEFDEGGGRWLLRKGLDTDKDQSYVLYAMTQEQLARTRFPLGELTKPQVREIAAAHGFWNARKRDSQDICFVPGGDYGAFLERWTGRALPPGDFLTPDGCVLGRHKGTARYTLGQRKGLGLALPRPGYVCAICPAENTVTVGDEPLLFSRELEARDINLIACARLERPVRCRAKVRYRQAEQPAEAEQTGPDTLRLRFDQPQRAITPGQAVVLYDGDTVIGGGTIGSA